MRDRVRRLTVVAALALPPALATCKSSEAPKTPTVNAQAFAGSGGIGLAGWKVNFRPAVTVMDSVGHPLSGATVSFAVTGGGGSATSLTATTNAQGIAQVGSWVLGATPGMNTMTASVAATGFLGSVVTFTDTGLAAGYTITIQPFGAGLPATAQTAFDSAVTKWERIIYRPLSSVSFTFLADSCTVGSPTINATTSGVIILASVDSIDGPGKVLAESAPCAVRTSNSLPLLGYMIFDSADIGSLISSGALNSVVLHEMNHVLGFGTLWGPPNSVVKSDCIQLLSNPPGLINDTYFSCVRARAAFDSAGGVNYTGGGSSAPSGNKVPVENCGTAPYVSPNCGGGTVNGHWREVVLANELMTGYLNNGANPLSVITVAADEDLGYTVNYAAADAWLHTFSAPPVGGAARVWLGDDVGHGPIYLVDAHGKVVGVVHPR